MTAVGNQENSDDLLEKILHAPFRQELEQHAGRCIECGLCVKNCTFLQKYGTPGHIATEFNPETLSLAFECSLCGLCTAVCPEKIGLSPASFFLAMRREAVLRGVQDFSKFNVILNYEKRGTSARYSYYALPEHCDTVLFPGCTLPGTRPDRVKALFTHLCRTIPTLGIVLDCCTKPSHDLGRDDRFHAMFNEMKGYLEAHGIRNILVTCPNCYRVFSRYGGPLHVKTVYELLAETSLPATVNIAADITVHDPCGTRNDIGIHAAVRRIAGEKSLHIREMAHHGPRTLCCGEGGSVGCVNPGFAKRWGMRRKEEAGGLRILTYCAGCAHFLGAVSPTMHILDLLFDPHATLTGQVKVGKAPWTYLNRLLLKRYFKKKIQKNIWRERTFTGENPAEKGRLQCILAGAVLFVFLGFLVLVLTGNVSLRPIIGIPLLAAVLLLPFFYKVVRKKKSSRE